MKNWSLVETLDKENGKKKRGLQTVLWLGPDKLPECLVEIPVADEVWT